MMCSPERLSQLKELLSGAPKQIALLCHTNPDGDTIGAALTWRAYLVSQGHQVRCFAPNRYPYFLEWLPDVEYIEVFKEDHDGAQARFVEGAEIIFSMDFNQISRLDRLTDTVEANTTAVRILIDHHLFPPLEEYVLAFSDTQSCSTCYIVYQMLVALEGADVLTKSMAEALYVGIMTDTGNFSYSHLSAHLFRAAAELIDRGVDVPRVHSAIYNNSLEGRMRLLGYVLHEKMTLQYEYGVAYVGLTEAEMRRFNFKQGDSEGFVNYPLTVADMKISALFTQHRKFIRVSLRSRRHIDVNLFARRYFNGGGHKNAAGGKSNLSMADTIERFKTAIAEFVSEFGL